MYKCDAISCSESCGLSVPIALYDMHECEIKENVKKKPKPHFENGNVKEQRIRDQPRSAFRFFMYVFYFSFLIFVTVSDLCSFIWAFWSEGFGFHDLYDQFELDMWLIKVIAFMLFKEFFHIF